MLCIFPNCLETVVFLCICGKSSFLCESHALIHQSSCKNPLIPIKSFRSPEETLRIKTYISAIKSSIISNTNTLIKSIEEISQKYLNDLSQIEIIVKNVESLELPQFNHLALQDLINMAKVYLGIREIKFEEFLLNDEKNLMEASYSTAESFASISMRNKNPVGVALEKDEAILWLQDYGFEFKAEEICEITTDAQGIYAFLCED